MKQAKPISRKKFSLGTKLVYQQDLSKELEEYVKTKHPDFANNFDTYFPRSSQLQRTLGERISIRCCLPVTMHRYLQAAGFLSEVSAMEYIDKVWPAFDYEKTKAWSRPILSKLTRAEYKVPIISCGISWLNSPFDEESRRKMIESGYCDNNDQIDQYLKLLHGKTVEQIIAEQPAVITIKSPKGRGMAHSVIAWDIEDNNLVYSNADERDGSRSKLTKASLEILSNNETKIGAITILV